MRQSENPMLPVIRIQIDDLSYRFEAWSWWQHVLWRWLLPFWAGEHYGRLAALRDLEVKMMRWDADEQKYLQELEATDAKDQA